MRLEAVQQRVAIANLAGRGLEKTGDDIECGRLAGAVRPDETDDFSFANREIEIGKRDKSAEMHGDVRDRKNDLSRCAACRHPRPSRGSELPANRAPAPLRVGRFVIQRWTAGTIPCGRRKTIAIIKPP